jgi:hypothetical protein
MNIVFVRVLANLDKHKIHSYTIPLTHPALHAFSPWKLQPTARPFRTLSVF